MLFIIKPQPRDDGVMLTSEALGVSKWCAAVDQAVHYARCRAICECTTIEIYDEAGGLIQMIMHGPAI